MTTEELLKLHEELSAHAREIMAEKNHDYTGGNGDPFANFRGSEVFGVHRIQGLILRMQDKLQRINTFASKGELKVKDEGVKDACLDLINYAVLAFAMATEENVNPETVWRVAHE